VKRKLNVASPTLDNLKLGKFDPPYSVVTKMQIFLETIELCKALEFKTAYLKLKNGAFLP
jgi:hypothetical protein